MANCRRSSADCLLSSITDSLNRSEERDNTLKLISDVECTALEVDLPKYLVLTRRGKGEGPRL